MGIDANANVQRIIAVIPIVCVIIEKNVVKPSNKLKLLSSLPPDNYNCSSFIDFQIETPAFPLFSPSQSLCNGVNVTPKSLYVLTCIMSCLTHDIWNLAWLERLQLERCLIFYDHTNLCLGEIALWQGSKVGNNWTLLLGRGSVRVHQQNLIFPRRQA